MKIFFQRNTEYKKHFRKIRLWYLEENLQEIISRKNKNRNVFKTY